MNVSKEKDQTHYEGCWEDPAHHEFAVRLIAELREESDSWRRVAERVRDDLRLAYAREIFGEASTAQSVQPSHPVSQVLWWANAYDKEGGHALIVQMLRAYAAAIAQPVQPSDPVARIEPNISYGQHEKEILEVIYQRDHREEIIDALCEAVLGENQREWSSAYCFDDAVSDVQERIAELIRRGARPVQPDDVVAQKPVGQLCESTFGRGQVMWFNKPPDGSMIYVHAATSVQPTRDLGIEIAAKAVYEKWHTTSGYVPWQDGGNSTMQEKARDLVRHAAQPVPPPETDNEVECLVREIHRLVKRPNTPDHGLIGNLRCVLDHLLPEPSMQPVQPAPEDGKGIEITDAIRYRPVQAFQRLE